MKKILLTIFQIAVTVFALYWVFRKPETRAQMLGTLQHGDYRWIIAAALMAGLAPVCAVVRWWSLLRVQKIDLTLWRATQLYMIGMFFNVFLLGSTGGDAVKLFYVLRGSDPQKRAGIILSVIMDRLLGLLALIILATVLVGLRYHWLTRTPATANLVNSFATVLLMGAGGLVTVFVIIKARLVDRLPAGMPGRSKLIELAAAVEVYTRAWPTFLGGICISFVGHSSFIFTYYFAARALSAAVRLYDMAVLLPIVNTIVSLPISLSGVGVREGLFKTLLQDLCGVGEKQSVPISIIGFLCTVIFYGLVGWIVYLFYRSGAGAVPANVEAVEAGMENAVMPAITEEMRHPGGAADV